jgi:predicted phosphodiesterase
VEENELAGRRLLIVGDVHGCYDELVELLDTCGARDPNICIAFVGDLTNKGPKSSEVIKLVHQLGAYCVRGNHDEVSLRTWQLYTEGERSLPTKFQWLRNLSKQEIQWYQGLPYSIRFPSREVLLVHAGLIPEVPLNQQSYDDLLHLKEVTFDTKTVTFSGCSSSPPPPNSQPWSQAWPGPDHIYFGHDARRFLQVHPFAIGVDTGCVYGGHLTAVFDDDRQKFIQVKARKIYDKGKKPPNIK